MSRRSIAIYFVLAVGVLAWAVWRDLNLPNCLALYGEAAHPTKTAIQAVIQSDKFLSCSASRDAAVFETEGIAIGFLFVVMVGILRDCLAAVY